MQIIYDKIIAHLLNVICLKFIYVKPDAYLYLGPNTPKCPTLFKAVKTWYFRVKPKLSSANEMVLEQQMDAICNDCAIFLSNEPQSSHHSRRGFFTLWTLPVNSEADTKYWLIFCDRVPWLIDAFHPHQGHTYN